MAKYDLLGPVSKEEIRPFLASAFNSQDGNKGSHSVLDTDWERVLSEFNGLYDVPRFLKSLQTKQDAVEILDEGCGSSQTLFQAIERIEDYRNGLTNGYGITASPEFLMQGAIPVMKEDMLRTFQGNPRERRKLELMLDGVQNNEAHGLHRFTPKGNLIKFLKGDLHYLGEVLSGKKIDLIYSSSTYPHLECPGLVLEESANSLKQNGLLLVDSFPIFTMVDKQGKSLSAEECKKRLEARNPNFRVYMRSCSNPFYVPTVVERIADDFLNAGELYSRKDLNQQSRVVNVLD